MAASNQELEVKFYLGDPSDQALGVLETRLQALDARLSQPRLHEVNLRFDTPGGDLARSYQVLRLRQDRQAYMTYKGPGTLQGEIKVRKELEVIVSDFATSQALLEALGYVVSLMYEKYRTVYALKLTALPTAHSPLPIDGKEVLVTLDEMPFGCFVEIEGPDSATIRAAADRLYLPWEARILESYVLLFEHARARLGFTFRDLSFANFSGLKVSAEDLGVQK